MKISLSVECGTLNSNFEGIAQSRPIPYKVSALTHRLLSWIQKFCYKYLSAKLPESTFTIHHADNRPKYGIFLLLTFVYFQELLYSNIYNEP